VDATHRLLTKLTIWGIILLVLYVIRRVAFRGAALKISKQMQKTYAPKHEWREVKASDFPELDQEFYSEMTQWLESLGYRNFGDAENVTLKEINPNMKHCLRYHISPDGSIDAAIYHVVAPNHNSKIFDIMTEFSNGEFVETSNATEASKMDSPPQIHHKFFLQSTPYDEILDAHAKSVAEYQTTHPGVSVVIIKGKEDIRASGDRQQAIKSAFRAGRTVSRQELARIAKPGQEEAARGVADEIERQKKS